MIQESVNLSRLADDFGDDPEFLRDVYTTYMKDCAGHLPSLKESITNQDPELRTFIAHTIKGSSANIGAEKVAEIAAELETLSHESAPEVGAEIYDRLMVEFDIARKFLNKFMETLQL